MEVLREKIDYNEMDKKLLEEEEEENAPPEEPVNASAVRAQADALPKSVYSGQPQAPLPDRYFIAEVSDEAALMDDDWASGEAAIAFTCQPFAYAVSEDGVTVQTSANAAKSAALRGEGGAPVEDLPLRAAVVGEQAQDGVGQKALA